MLSARFGRTPSLVHRPARVRQIKLAVDDDPGLGIDRVLVRLFPGAAHSAVTVVLRRVMLGIGDKEIAMDDAGKMPACIVLQIFELTGPWDGFPIGEISDGIIAADREPRFLSSGCGSEQDHEQREERGRPRKRKKRNLPHRLPPVPTTDTQLIRSPRNFGTNYTAGLLGEVKRIDDARACR
jgi:hypothetical protein